MNSRDEQLAQRVLGDPAIYPDEFKAYIPRLIEGNPNLRLYPSQLPAVELARYFGAAGNPALSGAWLAYGLGFEDPGMYRDPFNRVYLLGTVKSGAAGSIIANLTAGYRPKNREIFTVTTDTGPGRVDVAGNGDVIHVSGGTGFVSLASIHYRAFS